MTSQHPMKAGTGLFLAATMLALAGCGGGGGGGSTAATPAPSPAAPAPTAAVATAPAAAAPPAPSNVTPSVKAYQAPFDNTWGTPDPTSNSRSIGNFECSIPASVAIQSAAVGPFRRYTGDCVLSYTVSAARATQLTTTNAMDSIQAEVAQALSVNFYDHFDWLIVLYDFGNAITNNPAGQYSTTFSRKNALPRRLIGGAVFAGIKGFTGGAFLHELHHEWSNNGTLPTNTVSHWGSSSVGGQLGGYERSSLVSLGGNQYKASTSKDFMWCPGVTDSRKTQATADQGWNGTAQSGNAIGYAPLELYSMGLLNETGLSPIQVAQNAVPSTVTYGQFSATGFTEYSVAQIKANIQAAEGVLPNTATAQKAYKAAVVVVTSKPKLADADLRSVAFDARWMGLPANPNTTDNPKCTGEFGFAFVDSNFFSATRGVGTLMLGGLSASIRSTTPAALE